jgi:hypothetical protein
MNCCTAAALIATLTRADGKSLVTKLPYTIIVTEIQIAPVFNPSMGYVTVPEQQVRDHGL